MTTSEIGTSAAAERYGTAFGGTAPALEHVTDLLAAQLAHRSVRAYLSDPLPGTVVPTLVAAAQSAASSSNLQLWSVVAVRDPARRARLAELAGGQAHVAQAPVLLVWLADLARARRIATARDGEGEGADFVESGVLRFASDGRYRVGEVNLLAWVEHGIAPRLPGGP
jgi:nitroreductase